MYLALLIKTVYEKMFFKDLYVQHYKITLKNNTKLQTLPRLHSGLYVNTCKNLKWANTILVDFKYFESSYSVKYICTRIFCIAPLPAPHATKGPNLRKFLIMLVNLTFKTHLTHCMQSQIFQIMTSESTRKKFFLEDSHQFYNAPISVLYKHTIIYNMYNNVSSRLSPYWWYKLVMVIFLNSISEFAKSNNDAT